MGNSISRPEAIDLEVTMRLEALVLVVGVENLARPDGKPELTGVVGTVDTEVPRRRGVISGRYGKRDQR